jgi:predicted phage replisome organizer
VSDNKKYYYLKLKENFFDSEEMIILQNMPDGYLYSDILMKLYLRSLKNAGKLMFKDLIPYTPSALAQVVRHQIGTVEKALQIFQELGLIEILDNGAIYMLDIQNFIGESSTEADRKRNYRAKIQKEIKVLGQTSDKCPDKNPPEIEIEKEININNNIYGQDDLDQKEQEKFTKPLWEEQFEKFYKDYPKKVKKQDVKKWFKKNKPSSELFSSMMSSLEQFRGSKDWLKEKGQYIPYPSTWLNQRRWEDEVMTKKQEQTKYEEVKLTEEEYLEKLKNGGKRYG